ncbi:MAG TPA: hypothetical protein PLE45_06265 [Spirochaetota bacterium]|nr:hypothetical protein [Spirochaetota bacterium]HOL56895.1 hypothetical protein [Spirochaetota bacterium]HPP04305.1 hypothetical protein [Spirochaetota bacterium]
MRRFILFFLVFQILQNSESLLAVTKLNKEFYNFEYYFTKKNNKFFLNITISPKKGFKLNGDGYPPLKIELKDVRKDNDKIVENINSKLIFNPKTVSCKGIKAGEKKEFKIEIKNLEEKFLIEVYLKVIPCDNSSCYISNDKILIEYNNNLDN